MTTGNAGLDALADAIAARVIEKIRDPDEARLFTVDEAARYIGRTPKALRHMIATKSISVVRDGGRVHLDRSDLDLWIEMHKVKG